MSQKKRVDSFPLSIINEIKKKKCARRKSKKIDQDLFKESDNWSKNIIVAGHSCSGKSSIIEQFKLQKIFTKELDEAKAATHGLRSHCLELLYNTSPSYALKLSNVDVSNGLNLDKYQEPLDQFLNELDGRACSNVSVATDFQSYLLNYFKRILDPGFSITFQDFVIWKKSSFAKTFVRDELTYPFRNGQFNVNITHFRKTICGKSKIYSYFDNSDIVLFCSSLKIYCHTNQSDAVKYQLEDEISYFKRLAGSHWFFDSDFILFLTHSDIFEAQFHKMYFPEDFLEFLSSRKVEAHGPNEFYEYIYGKFYDALQIYCPGRRLIFKFSVNCVNCENMQKTMRLISDLPFSCKGCRSRLIY